MSTERTLLSRFAEPDEEVENRMIRALDALLFQPPRMDLPAGATVFRQNDLLDGIYILMNGKVKLYQELDGREVIFHSQTAGKILGLLSLTRQSQSFFTCRTVTPVQLLFISFKELDRALQQSDSLLVAFITVLLRSMARRSTRLVELQTEVLALNKSLSTERDTLARTLRELEQAQAMLVESEKMATLGQMAAGVAHELNNPISAIHRAADFLYEDLLNLAGELPDRQVFKTMLISAMKRKPISTREQREIRHRLTALLGNAELAERLVGMGIHEAVEYQRLAGDLTGTEEEKLQRMERYQQLGGALRNISRCAERIADLVKSLRSYSRSEEGEEKIDLHDGLEDTLRLFSNRMRDVTVDRQYADLPPIQANAGELNQVWTNLIANALEAMKDAGQLTIITSLEPDEVAVRIIDDGPGIPPEYLEKIFSLRFTTRQGRIEFGLGLGLSISSNIVARHGGTIQVHSEPGRTEFCVKLPLSTPYDIASPKQEHQP